LIKAESSNMKSADACKISERATIRKAMDAINRGKCHLALVVDDLDRLVGIVSDGDVRRALLRSLTIDHPIREVMNRSPITVTSADSAERVRQLLHRFLLTAVPMVDDDGRVLGLITPFEAAADVALVKSPVAVIMAGGEGRRLRPLTKDVPKPMLVIGDRPLLEQVICRLEQSGITRIFLAINYLGKVIRDHFGDGGKFGVQIEYLEERQRLGTAGALSMLPDDIAGPILVMNGDVITGVEYQRLFAFHAVMDSSLTVVVANHEVRIPFGVVAVENELVTGIREKPVHRSLINAGVYVVERKVLELLRQDEAADMTDLIGRAIAAGERLVPFPIHEAWLDIGTPSQLEEAAEIVHVLVR
jgi:dTDP-glucose pyrophosphorylase